MSLPTFSYTYTNPIIPGFYPDPSICRVDSDYYIVNSTFQYFPGLPVWHSRDLVNWEQIGNAIDRESQMNLSGANGWGGLYAPTIRYNDGIFYIINTNVSHGQNFFITATDPKGPWSDPIWLKQGGIDPSFYFEDGKCYFVSNPDAGIWLCEIDPVTGEQLTESKLLWRGTGGRHPEGPHIYKKDGWYYLLISEGGTEHAHMITIARSKDIYGPYESNPDNPILTHCNFLGQSSPIQGTGHADIVQAPDGSWWLVCLAFRPQSGMNHLTGRETYLAPVSWDEGQWPIVNDNGTIQPVMEVKLPVSGDIPPQRTWDVSYDFTKDQNLGFEWVYLRKKISENYSLSEKGLVLKGNQWDLNSIQYPTFVARRQQHINFETTSSMVLEAKEPGDKGGMTVFMDGGFHYDLYLEKTTGGYEIKLEYWLGSIHHVQPVVATSQNHVDFKITGSTYPYNFYYSLDGGKTYQHMGVAETRFLSSETAGGFTGIMLGLFATGKGKPEAIFKSFTYTGNDRY